MKKQYVLLLVLLAFATNNFAQTLQMRGMKFSLDEAVSYALDSSYQSQGAMLDIYYSRKQVWEAKSIGLPQVNASADYNYNIKNLATPFPADIIPEDMRPEGVSAGDNILLSFGTKQTMSASVGITQKVFDGSYIVALQSAKTVAKITELAGHKTDVIVSEAVSLAYLTVLMSEETIDILERNIANVSKNIDQISAMYENGFVEEQDVQQLQLNLSSLKNTLDRSKRLLNINGEMLKFSMGLDINQTIELTDSIEAILLKSYQLTSLESVLELDEHIDFQISQNQLKTNELLIKYEKSKYLPNISAFMNAGYNSYSEIFDFFRFKEDKWAPLAVAGLQLNIPVFSSFQKKARVDMATIDYKKAELAHDELVQRLFMNLHIAQDAYAFSIANYLNAQDNLSLAESIEYKENIKYQEGISTSLDLTNAQNQLYFQQDQYLNSIVSVIQSKIALDKALDKF